MVNFGPLVAEILWRVYPCKFQLVLRLGSFTARHSTSGRQPNCGVEQRAPPIFGRAAITLGIGPHSSTEVNFLLQLLKLKVLCTMLPTMLYTLHSSSVHENLSLDMRF